jgi:hypothetical protein
LDNIDIDMSENIMLDAAIKYAIMNL